MRYTIFSLAIICSLMSRLFAQHPLITYHSTYAGNPTESKLYVADTLSYWEDMLQPDADPDGVGFVLKNIPKGNLYVKDFIFTKSFYVTDTLHPMSWRLTDQLEKTILQYRCKAAYTFFRGRNYLAYYAPELPYALGPWKFGGLPGMILAIETEDRSFGFEALSIAYPMPFAIPLKKLSDYEWMNWGDFCRQFTTSVNHYAHYLQTVQAADGGTVHLKVDRLEIIYPEAQSGIGISN